MTAKEIFAATLKDRKGIQARRDDPPPAPAPPPRAPGVKGRRRARYSSGQHALLLLEAQLRAANRRADKAEAALAELQDTIKVMWDKNRKNLCKITHLEAIARRSAREAQAALAERDRVKATNEKVWRLNQEIARLRAAAKDRPSEP
jgi:hypothetical protein